MTTKKLVTGFALLSFLFVCGSLLAQDTYTLELKYNKGEKYTVVTESQTSIEITATTPDGQKQEFTIEEKEEEKYAVEIVETKDGEITKERRKYHYSRKTEKDPSGEEVVTKSPFHGKLYEAVVADGKTEVRCLNATISSEKEKTLEITEDMALLLPTKPVKVGDSWEADPEKILTNMLENDESTKWTKASCKCKLEKIDDVGGEKCAVISSVLEATGKSANAPFAEMTMTIPGVFRFSLTNNKPLSYSTEDATITISGDNNGMHISGKGTISISMVSEVGTADLEGGEEPEPPQEEECECKEEDEDMD